MRAVCSGTGRRGCCGWSDMAKPPEITAPTPLSTFRLTYSPTVSDPEWDSSGLIRPSNRTGDRQSLRDIAAERKLPRTSHKSHKNAMLSVPRLHLHEPSAVRLEKARRKSSPARSFGAFERLRFE